VDWFPVRNAKRGLAGLLLIERNRGSDVEQISKAQDAGYLGARVMHDPDFVCGTHHIVPPGQNFDPSGN
jgi:hypothetical protein